MFCIRDYDVIVDCDVIALHLTGGYRGSNFNLYETIYTAKHSLFWLVVFQERSYNQLNINDIF